MIHVKDFNISSFAVRPPTKRSNRGYGSVVTYNNQDVMTQTPVCTVEKISDDGIAMTFSLAENFEHFQFFCSIYEIMLKRIEREIAQNPDILTGVTDARSKFRTTAVKSGGSEMTIFAKTSKKTKCFTEDRQEISILELKAGSKIVAVIRSGQISMDAESANHSWDMVQLMILT